MDQDGLAVHRPSFDEPKLRVIRQNGFHALLYVLRKLVVVNDVHIIERIHGNDTLK